MKLNVGCGVDYRGGYVNVDIESGVKRDGHLDMLKFPWPFPDASCDEVLFSHVLEHVPGVVIDGRDALVRILDEVHRILRPGGKLVVHVPYWGRAPRFILSNPTHYRIISPETFLTFTPGRTTHLEYASTARFNVEAYWVSKRHPPFAHLLRINGHGLTVHLRDRLFGRLLDVVPYEGRLLIRKAPAVPQ